jgi:hypothetical protein
MTHLVCASARDIAQPLAYLVSGEFGNAEAEEQQTNFVRPKPQA